MGDGDREMGAGVAGFEPRAVAAGCDGRWAWWWRVMRAGMRTGRATGVEAAWGAGEDSVLELAVDGPAPPWGVEAWGAGEGSVLELAVEGLTPPGRVEAWGAGEGSVLELAVGAGEAEEGAEGPWPEGAGHVGFSTAIHAATADSITSAVRPAARASSSMPGGR